MFLGALKSKTIWFTVLKVLVGLVAWFYGWVDINLLGVVLGEAVISAGLRVKTYKPLGSK